MGETSKANLKEFIKETIRKRPDFTSSRYNTNMTVNMGATAAGKSDINLRTAQNSS